VGENVKLSVAETLQSQQDRLDTWKEIAKYLGRQVRTVQLWEKNEGLPVYRHMHQNLGSVYAFRSELSGWLESASRRSANSARLDEDRERSVRGTTGCSEDSAAVAVLPFKNAARSAEQAVFEDGMMSQMIVAMQHHCPKWLRVVSRTAMRDYNGSPGFIDQLCRDLRVKYLIEGATHLENGRIRIDLSLVRVSDHTPVWSHSYHGKPRNSLELQRGIADEIAHCAAVALLSVDVSAGRRPVANAAAWETYQLGRFLWRQRTYESVMRAVEVFKRAIDAEPGFAPAHSGLADCFTVLAFFGMLPPTIIKDTARRAAQTAVQLDPVSAETHASLGMVLFHFDQDWARAETEFQEAMRRDPRYTFAYHGYAMLLSAKGQHEAAQIAIKRAAALDPSPVTIMWLGSAAHSARRYEEAIRHYRRALEFDPNFPWAHLYMAQTLEQLGEVSEALSEYETVCHLCPGNNVATAMKAHAYAALGDKRAALRLVGRLSQMPGRQLVPACDIAAVYAALGEHKLAWPWLNRALIERDVKVFMVAQDPRFDAIRGRDEFQMWIGRLGLLSERQST
jgi:TolB-like protein/tetratricopeptide (TPR) repeat protein